MKVFLCKFFLKFILSFEYLKTDNTFLESRFEAQVFLFAEYCVGFSAWVSVFHSFSCFAEFSRELITFRDIE